MSARQSRIGRTPVSYMLAPATVERLARLADASGESRGKIIDRAVASLDTASLRAACAEMDRVATHYDRRDEDAIANHWRAIGALSVSLSRMARAAGLDELADKVLGPLARK